MFKFSSRYSNSLAGGAFSTPIAKRFMNHCKEYWYMGSMPDKSTMQKKSYEALNATGLYPSLALSICSSVILESWTLWLISMANFFEFYNWLMRVSSVRTSLMSPAFSARLFKIWSSMLSSSFLSAAFLFTISTFFCSS